MNLDQRLEYQTRSEILKLLSDREASLVSTAETGRIPVGEEYLDLEHLERGVLRADPGTQAAHTIPRAAVRDTTWAKILMVLIAPDS